MNQSDLLSIYKDLIFHKTVHADKAMRETYTKQIKTTELACTVCELLIKAKMQNLECVNIYKISPV